MRFFLSCFGGSGDTTGATKPLVPPRTRTLHRNKSHWRPALGSISEDTAPPHRERTAAASAGDGKRKDNPAAAATTKSPRRQYSDDYDYGPRRVSMPSVMPAFSPTPFMF